MLLTRRTLIILAVCTVVCTIYSLSELRALQLAGQGEGGSAHSEASGGLSGRATSREVHAEGQGAKHVLRLREPAQATQRGVSAECLLCVLDQHVCMQRLHARTCMHACMHAFMRIGTRVGACCALTPLPAGRGPPHLQLRLPARPAALRSCPASARTAHASATRTLTQSELGRRMQGDACALEQPWSPAAAHCSGVKLQGRALSHRHRHSTHLRTPHLQPRASPACPQDVG